MNSRLGKLLLVLQIILWVKVFSISRSVEDSLENNSEVKLVPVTSKQATERPTQALRKNVDLIPAKVVPQENVDLLDSCNSKLSNDDVKLIGDVESSIKSKTITDPIIVLATFDAMTALEVQLDSIDDNAPGVKNRLLIFCVGEDTCKMCRSLHDKCFEDNRLMGIINGTTGANSMGFGAASGAIDRAYVDIIWRKPELIQLVLAAGAGSVIVVDTDGAWFREPPSTFADSVAVSSEYSEPLDYLLTAERCSLAMVYRKAPLIINSGTVYIKNDDIGKALIKAWVASRAARLEGGCDAKVTRFDHKKIMLDQDGLNLVACQAGQVFSGKVRGLSFNQVLLNSIHAEARQSTGYDICKPWFFHSTNCGSTKIKATCLLKNLERRKSQC